MAKVRLDALTRAKVLLLGFSVIPLGFIAYHLFRLIGIDEVSSGIANQIFLVLLLFGWTGSYLFRVFTGKMTFVEQRKRYLEEYEKLTSAELQTRFESMSEEEQINLLKELEKD